MHVMQLGHDFNVIKIKVVNVKHRVAFYSQ